MKSALETPMMRQYLAIKARHPDALVFYRMGDFYELFLHDAEVAAPLLDIALTTRDKGKADAVPMCGVPVHGADPHIQRLTELGYRVAICEQVEDAKAAAGKRLVKRDVVEVVTPGLVGDPSGLVGHREVALASLEWDGAGGALAVLEATTGELRVVAAESFDALLAETERVAPRELLAAETLLPALEEALAVALPELVRTATPVPAGGELSPASERFELHTLSPPERIAVERILGFVRDHQPHALDHITQLEPYALHETMELDGATRRHLELVQNAEDGSRRGTLIERIDSSRSALGARRLLRWLDYPLLDVASIRRRQRAVTFWFERDRERDALRAGLAAVGDLERVLAKAARPGAGPRELVALRRALEALPAIREVCELRLEGAGAIAGAPGDQTHPVPADCSEWAALIAGALVDDPPALPRGSRGALETGYIREGYRADLDALRESADKGREWIAGLETLERERTGIANLKVRFHPVHGYTLEVSKAQLERVPEDYERRQTLANAERFTTPALREVEAKVLGARERAAGLERQLFDELRDAVLRGRDTIAAAARAVGILDAIAALAEVARRDAWVRPEVDDGLTLEVEAGRHPVVEPLVLQRGDEFVPNDTRLDSQDPEGPQILLLTGPNMSGKSTYLRQTALITLLAQVGSFVPATQARVGIVDRIFTRVGASDRLAQGDSTFMVEMRETAEILSRATRRSLIVLDEIGRGTSTFDGLSIAWAVAEHLHDADGLGARTLFATHYHELTELAEILPRLRNAHFAAREWGDDVVFLRRLEQGGANRSYGIQVARLAGLPDAVLSRAREVLAGLEARDPRPPASPTSQLGLFEASPALSAAERAVIEEIRASDPDRIRPLDALAELARWRERLEGEDE